MCGLGGYVGVTDYRVRLLLTAALGEGIDSRGGHAAGFVSLPIEGSADGMVVQRKLGKWRDTSLEFVQDAALGEVGMFHARYATMGAKEDVCNAHPFTISRNGIEVLVGCHNGVLQGTDDTAKKYGRGHTVDSLECFELLADGNHEAIQSLTGYGVLTWVEHGTGDLLMACLSKGAPIVACELDGGGLVYASTSSILEDALRIAHATGKSVTNFDLGRVYKLTATGVIATDRTGVHVGERFAKSAYGYTSQGYADEDERWWLSPAYAGTSIVGKAHAEKGKAKEAKPDHTHTTANGDVWSRVKGVWSCVKAKASQTIKSDLTPAQSQDIVDVYMTDEPTLPGVGTVVTDTGHIRNGLLGKKHGTEDAAVNVSGRWMPTFPKSEVYMSAYKLAFRTERNRIKALPPTPRDEDIPIYVEGETLGATSVEDMTEQEWDAMSDHERWDWVHTYYGVEE